MTLFSPRLSAVLTLADLARLTASSYARENGVSDELGRDRMERALQSTPFAERIYHEVSEALRAVQGDRTEDALVDKLSKAVARHRAAIKPAPRTPALSALMVLINVDLGLSPEELRATLESDKGRPLLEQGYQQLGKHLVGLLVR